MSNQQQQPKMCLLSLSLLLLLYFPTLVSAACEVLPNGSPCSCQYHDGKNIINCKRKGLDAVPQFNDVTQTYDELTLSGNDITRLDNNKFAVLKIRKLDLSGNAITVIEDDAFAGLNSELTELILHVDGLSASQFPTQALSVLTNLEILTLEGFNMPSFPDEALTQLASLRELHTQSCNLQQLDEGDVQGQRNTLQVLDLGSNSFQSIPTAVKSLQALNSLVLTGNSLNTLHSDAFQGVSGLRELDLSQNSIQQIQSDAFKGLEDLLEVLRMQHCHLAQQQLAPMSGLHKLVDLDLANNAIGGIDVGFFTVMTKLQTLNLANNGVSSLTTSTFDGLDNSLQSLTLERNAIGSIQANSFGSLRSLQTLGLSYQTQSLSSDLKENTFAGIEDTLQTLGLADVGFTDSDWVSVNRLVNLRSLDLGSNSIQNVPDSTFLDMQYLETILLSGNDLHTLTQRGMRGLETSLKTLKLDGNDIEVIDHCVFADFQLTSLDLYQNPLQCDCQLTWLREWTEELSEGDKDSIQWTCATPAQHAGKQFMSLAVSEFTCSGGDQPPECEDFTPTTTTAKITNVPPEEPELAVEVANFTATAVHILWTVAGGQDITGFNIEYFIIGEEEYEYEETDQYARHYYLDELEPDTSYYICVGAKQANSVKIYGKTCVDAKTEPRPEAVEEETNSTAIIVAAVLGAIFVIAVVIVIVCLVRRCRKEPDEDLSGFTMADAPKLGYNSKRFSKPKSQSLSVQNLVNDDLDKKLEGFSPEERDKIINMLTTSGASTLSMISNPDPTRYVPEPPPMRQQGGAEGYMNPTDVKSDEDNYYFEIPDDDENYDQIPGDRVGQRQARPQSLSGSVYI